MFFSSAVAVVFKTTGGRLWNKPWGLPRLSRTRRANRRKNLALFNKNISVLRAAAAAEPEVPVRLNTPLPQWQKRHMARHLERAQRLLNWRGAASLLPPLAQHAAEAGGAGAAAAAAGRTKM